MSIKKFPLEAYGAAVSREELVQAALDEITKNYREASLSNVARSYGNIQQIITYVGYENTSYFYRLFHERYGQSPREYRQSRAARTRTPA